MLYGTGMREWTGSISTLHTTTADHIKGQTPTCCHISDRNVIVGQAMMNKFRAILLFLAAAVELQAGNEHTIKDDEKSSLSRKMASLGSTSTFPSEPTIPRSSYPEKHPHICLAFLSCCGRTDLLNHTLAGAIRHMEEDEPSFLRYEIAWVDNGSGETATSQILDSYEIEHAMVFPKNLGLAYGMNMLINNLCTAPYILLLEEDWLYLDEVVAPQTEERKRAIASSVALLENINKHNVTAFDGRTVMGVFLRHETYDSFLQWPHADLWERREAVDIQAELQLSEDGTSQCADGQLVVDIDYRIFCSDPSLQKSHIWGSYTNGAGLYRRSELSQVGRMYGEPGDPFHDRYTEGNFAYRAGLQHCHAALRLTKDTSCISIDDVDCTGAFHHIGGGRGTRPMNAKGTACEDFAWNFFGTPMYDKFHKFTEHSTNKPVKKCTRSELKELQDRKFRDSDSEEYRRKVKESNKAVFEREKEQRNAMRREARMVLDLLESGKAGSLRSQVEWLAGKTDDQIKAMAERIERLADSPHPLAGFWDSHGRIVDQKEKAGGR
eukprot:scaffold346_cov116-Cylindrotheca_fusiformis.AAC.18